MQVMRKRSEYGGVSNVLTFAGFRLAPGDQRIWRGGEVLPMTPKAFRVLCHLAGRPQRLVTKQDLLDAVWGDVHVGDAVLKGAILEIRRVLGDEARAPRIVATEHRRGYRFIAAVTPERSRSVDRHPSEGRRPHRAVVGRSDEEAVLRAMLAEAEDGGRRLAMVVGGSGYGKTALVGAFLRERGARRDDLAIATGQCLASGGPAEPYLPIFDALGGSAADRLGAEVRAVLRDIAPAALVHLPALIDRRELEGLLLTTAATRPEQMLRQLAEAIEALSLRCPLVLVLDDLHWSDEATLDLVAALMRRRAPARLLVVAAYRPDGSAAAARLESIKHDLATRARAREIVLEGLDEAAVAESCGTRLALPPDVARSFGAVLHRRCGGHPLFMEASTEELARRAGQLAPAGEICTDRDIVVPRSVHDFIRDDLRRLDPVTRVILETASVSSTSLGIPALAAATGLDATLVEEICLGMADRRHFVAWQSGTPPGAHDPEGRIGFRHDIYREAVLAQLPTVRRAVLHGRVGDRSRRHSAMTRPGTPSSSPSTSAKRDRGCEPAANISMPASGRSGAIGPSRRSRMPGRASASWSARRTRSSACASSSRSRSPSARRPPHRAAGRRGNSKKPTSARSTCSSASRTRPRSFPCSGGSGPSTCCEAG
jgi:DNA-binding winged helix-turn-helix (wHTH) protein